MSQDQAPPSVSPEAKPRLAAGVRLVRNEGQGGWVLLAPERVLKADPIAAEILRRCTGDATINAIVDELAETYATPRDRILADVTTLLSGLVEKKLVEV
jgi:pyrroloquinoline quinone biosynthesis protein D